MEFNFKAHKNQVLAGAIMQTPNNLPKKLIANLYVHTSNTIKHNPMLQHNISKGAFVIF